MASKKNKARSARDANPRKFKKKTSVLIIEDEPLIAMQLEDLVGTLGHTTGAGALGSAAVGYFSGHLAARADKKLMARRIEVHGHGGAHDAKPYKADFQGR